MVMAEDAWNPCDPEKVARAYPVDSGLRNPLIIRGRKTRNRPVSQMRMDKSARLTGTLSQAHFWLENIARRQFVNLSSMMFTRLAEKE
jgi:nuclear transport factor 2 (NTF2) superfamily protein